MAKTTKKIVKPKVARSQATDPGFAKKLKAEAAQVVKDTEAKLQPIFEEIDARLMKADRADKDTKDHRLAAALKLEEARKIAEGVKGFDFKAWVAKNFAKSYETVRKLIAIGRSENPAKAIEDLRLRTKKAAAKHRAKAKVEVGKLKVLGPVDALRAAKPEAAMAAIKTIARENGLVLAPKDATPAIDTVLVTGLVALKKAFAVLPSKDQMAFVTYAANVVGVKIVDPFDTPSTASETAPSEKAKTASAEPVTRRRRQSLDLSDLPPASKPGETTDDLLDIPAALKRA